jgi:hypothetical protein
MHEAARLCNYTHESAMRAYPVLGTADDGDTEIRCTRQHRLKHEWRGTLSHGRTFAPARRTVTALHFAQTAKWARRLHATCVSLLPAHTVKEKITMEDLSWLRLLQKPRVDKIPPEAIERKLRALQLVERDGKQLAVTRKGQIAIRLFG